MNVRNVRSNLASGKMIRSSTDLPSGLKKQMGIFGDRVGASEFYKRQTILKWTFPEEVALTRRAQYAVQTAGSPTRPFKTLGQVSDS